MKHPHKRQIRVPITMPFRNEFEMAFERECTSLNISTQIAMWVRWFNTAEDTGNAKAKVLLNMAVDPFGESYGPLDEPEVVVLD